MIGETPIYGYLEDPSMVDYPAHLAAVFFTSGCNFSCGFCHNAALIGQRQEGLAMERLEAVCARFRRDWVNGVVVTGGEPTCAPELSGLLRWFKERFGFAVKLDTNGSHPDRLAECLPFVDYVAMDVKCGFSAYPDVAGFPDAGRISESIALIRSRAKDYELRTTVVETIHTDEQMDEIRKAIDGARRYVLQAFVPRDNLPGERYRQLPRTTARRLRELKARMHGCADEILLRGA